MYMLYCKPLFFTLFIFAVCLHGRFHGNLFSRIVVLVYARTMYVNSILTFSRLFREFLLLAKIAKNKPAREN